MGAYLSQPVTNKVSTDEYGKRVDCGASSMQGWRVSQEDAHNSTLDFDANTSLFAVYDGHGGHEVAEYCSTYFPEFLKKCENYTKEKYVEALKEAFLGFDATLATSEVIAILKEISGKKDGEDNSISDDDEENVTNLKKEAEMPLDQVIAKYHNDMNQHLKKAKSSGVGLEKSPLLRSRRACTSARDELSASGSGAGGSSSSDLTEAVGSSGSIGQNSSSIELKEPVNEPDKVFDCATSNGVIETSTKLTDGAEVAGQELEANTSIEKEEEAASIQKEESKTETDKTEDSTQSSDKKPEVNGEVGGSGDGKHMIECEDAVDRSSPHENGITHSEGKGKGKAIISKQDVSPKTKSHMALRHKVADALYKSLLGAQEKSDSDSDSDDDDGDENFEGMPDSSDDEGVDGVDNEEGDGEEEEDEDDDSIADDEEEEEEEEEEDDFSMKMTDEPGSDSGCTAVVALLRGRELHVANAGDSRCIVCHGGKAIDMSVDHKPEDEGEMKRIVNAGGKVTADGRVNGGLNLSRALGDHAYKLNTALPPEEQMITALPDVRTLMLDPLEDEFIFLACDGIWNFMSSQEVCDFIRPRITDENKKLSEICEELFDHCLAADTLGDGTGCDNMTAVLVRIKPELAEIAESRSIKRPASPAKGEEAEKRPRTEEHV